MGHAPGPSFHEVAPNLSDVTMTSRLIVAKVPTFTTTKRTNEIIITLIINLTVQHVDIFYFLHIWIVDSSQHRTDNWWHWTDMLFVLINSSHPAATVSSLLTSGILCFLHVTFVVTEGNNMTLPWNEEIAFKKSKVSFQNHCLVCALLNSLLHTIFSKNFHSRTSAFGKTWV